MELKYKSWDNITIKIFNKLNSIKLEEYDDDSLLNANVKLLSILCDADEQEIESLPLHEFGRLIKEMSFIEKPLPQTNIKMLYNINGNVYHLNTNIKKMTTAQYIDFQTLYKQDKSNVAKILACFMIPKGKKYGEYDIDDVVKELNEHFSIVDAETIMFFFAESYQKLITNIRISLTKQMNQNKKITPQMKKLMNQAMDLWKDGVGL